MVQRANNFPYKANADTSSGMELLPKTSLEEFLFNDEFDEFKKEKGKEFLFKRKGQF